MKIFKSNLDDLEGEKTSVPTFIVYNKCMSQCTNDLLTIVHIIMYNDECYITNYIVHA